MLPLIDEHAVAVAAGAAGVWRALLTTVDRRGGGAFARLIGCEPASAGGPRPLTEGSTIPGFRVIRARPSHELGLEGRHRFSTYALTFTIDELDTDRARLRAESRASFPGPHGQAYRLIVIRSGGHVLAVRALLSAIQNAAGRGRN
ncbi:MAG TPA: hypothetical protein VNB24_10070 [Acidimicrobiales bacterium]|nr:hypothetical protein [Acidimicrobiales bacterium]